MLKMMRTVIAAGVAIGAIGCQSREQVSESSHSVVLMSTTGDTTAVFADEKYKDRLQEVLDGKQPMDFHWVAITLSSDDAVSAAHSASGLDADLSNAASGIGFQEVYQDVCNPAKEDFSPCYLYEGYRAGDVGLSGTVHIQLTNATASAGYDLAWEGQTLRFGDPEQWHRHLVSASYAAQIGGAK